MQYNMQTQEQALQILIQAVQKGNKAGAFDLAESAIIAQAVAVFAAPAKPEEKPVEAKESKK